MVPREVDLGEIRGAGRDAVAMKVPGVALRGVVMEAGLKVGLTEVEVKEETG